MNTNEDAFRAGFQAALAAVDGISVWRDTTEDAAVKVWGDPS